MLPNPRIAYGGLPESGSQLQAGLPFRPYRKGYPDRGGGIRVNPPACTIARGKAAFLGNAALLKRAVCRSGEVSAPLIASSNEVIWGVGTAGVLGKWLVRRFPYGEHR